MKNWNPTMQKLSKATAGRRAAVTYDSKFFYAMAPQPCPGPNLADVFNIFSQIIRIILPHFHPPFWRTWFEVATPEGETAGQETKRKGGQPHLWWPFCSQQDTEPGKAANINKQLNWLKKKKGHATLLLPHASEIGQWSDLWWASRACPCNHLESR